MKMTIKITIETNITNNKVKRKYMFQNFQQIEKII